MKKLPKRLSISIVVVGFAMAAALVGASPATADAKNITITATERVNMRTGPGTQYPVVGKLDPGASPDYECYSRGENIGGTDVWFKVRYNGAEGFYTSYYDNVPLAAQSDLPGTYGIADCDNTVSQDSLNQDLQNGGLSTNFYDGQRAAEFALDNAMQPQPLNFSGCTWFASNALWAGGLPQTPEWNSDGLKGTLRKSPGTNSATAAADLYTYLVDHGLAKKVKLTDRLGSNAVPEAQPGDLIAYQWNDPDTNDDTVVPDHFAVVVDIAPGDYPEVSE